MPQEKRGAFIMAEKNGSKKKSREKEIFSFCIGRPWPAGLTDRPSPDNVCVYMYGSQVHTGTMKDARDYRKHVNRETGKKNFIYKLVKIPE